MNFKIERVIYNQPRTILVKKDPKLVAFYRKQGFVIIQEFPGCYKMKKFLTVEVQFETEAGAYSQQINHLIKQAYGVSKVTEREAVGFMKACETNTIGLKCSKKRGLYLDS